MNRRVHLLLSLLSACIACTLVYIVYTMQLKQVEQQQVVQIVVPTQFVDAGQLLTARMVSYKPIVASAYDARMFRHVEEVIGQETGVPLGEGEPILDWKLNKYSLLPSGEQSTFQIPKHYILAVSNSIRAGDRVTIYTSSAQGESRRLFREEIVVASVKSAANVEVEDSANSSLLAQVKGDEERLYASRRHANAAIDHLNLNLTEEQWLLIDNLCRTEGVKLVIAFTSSARVNHG